MSENSFSAATAGVAILILPMNSVLELNLLFILSLARACGSFSFMSVHQIHSKPGSP